jgi:curli biogenesis system outer membrane secretion channel CsgG
MKPKLIQLTVALALVAGLISCAAEQSQATLRAQAKVTLEEATKTALAQVPNGQVKSAELEEEDGILVWSFDISTPESKDITEILVDAKTGKFVSREIETSEDQMKEAEADKKEKK